MPKKSKLRPKVPCYCTKCNGNLVDMRTRKKHEDITIRLQESVSKSSQEENKDDPRPPRSARTLSDSRECSVKIRKDNTYDDDIVMIGPRTIYKYVRFIVA